MGKGFEAYGTDALRFTLCNYPPTSKRIPLSPKKIEGFRHFCNKIWNAVRFAMPYLDGATVGAEAPAPSLRSNRWILSRLRAASLALNDGIDAFRFDDATNALYRFFWGELCDWHLELCKPIFAGGDETLKRETQGTLAYALEASMRALHPFMPFITEELWQRLPRPAGSPESLALAPLPDRRTGRADARADAEMAIVQAVIGAARSIRSERDVHPGAAVPLSLRSGDASVRALLEAERQAVEALVKTESLAIEPSGALRPAGAALSAAAGVEVLVTLRGVVDRDKELARVEREHKKTEKDIAAVEKTLSAKGFADRAPPEVVVDKQRQLVEARERLELLQQALELAREL
jgi:valyl-tRNA synthetase